jgi:predicted NBD/HSP70 family sugar kinase
MHQVLVIDIGGTNIKLLATGQEQPTKIPSGPTLTPEQLVTAVTETTRDWNIERISVGFPGPIAKGAIVKEPVNLGPGWLGFDFEKAFEKPVKLINDAAMQALGGYEGGRMLFLGLGTGLGTCMIIDGTIAPLELGHLPYRKGLSFEDYVGVRGLKDRGKRRWREAVFDVVARLKDAMQVEYVVLGGGNVKNLDKLPEGARRGDNRNAFTGGFRLWNRDVVVALPQD